MRLRAKVDRNQKDVVEALRKSGALVESLARLGRGCPDIVCAKHGRVVLMEIKHGKGKLTAAQQTWMANGWPIYLVRSPEDAIEALQVALQS